MSERVIRVPEALIEELGAADDANEGERFYGALHRLRALLSQEATEPLDLAEQTAVVRRLDAEFLEEGGSTRHWVQALNDAGYVIAVKEQS